MAGREANEDERRLTIVHDAEVQIAHEGAAGQLRETCDGMGALLRFRLQP